ncbi:MAG: hypothetical protein R3192_08560 [Woeseiaceae bacterium]|nr:hypothetical protein [Woeseiaceae bacterium]
MAKQSKDKLEMYDELDFVPDFDPEFYDDLEIDDTGKSASSVAAWQRIEMRKESDWLRNQVVDWDDWDEYFEAH